MSQNLLVCQHCQTYFFTDLEETNCCPHCNSQLEMSDITYENYKSMPKVKKCKNCKRKYPKIFIKCPKCNQQLIKLSTENKQLDKQVNEIRKEIQEHQEKQSNLPLHSSHLCYEPYLVHHSLVLSIEYEDQQ